MYLLTEWAGRTGKYVARGRDNTRCASWLRAKYFPVRPYLQSMTLNLGHIALIPVFVSSSVVLKWFFGGPCPSSRPTLEGKGKRGRAQHVNVIPSIDPSSNVMDCSSVNKHFIIWHLCFLIFFDGAKTHSWQHLPRFARAFLRRAVRVFSTLSLDAYRPHTELFSQGFPTKLCAGTCHMITYLIILACVTPTRFNLKTFP